MPTTVQHILVVDDEPLVCSMMRDVLTAEGDRRCTTCATASEACDALDRASYDVVITDVRLPGMSGLELLQRIVRRPESPPVIVTSGASMVDSARHALRSGAFDFIQKPLNPMQLRRTVNEAMSARARPPRNAPSAETDTAPQPPASGPTPAQPRQLRHGNRAPTTAHYLKQAGLESVRALVAAVETKDPYTEQHSLAVCAYSEIIATALELPPDQIQTLKNAAILHDVGKIGIPDAILRKPTRLTHEEYAIIKTHADLAVQILGHMSFLSEELPLIRYHHERYDGAGYPAGLAGDKIPFGARILSVADAMETMLTGRTYQPRRDAADVQAELLACAGAQFDPRVTEIAADWLEQYPSVFRMTGAAHRQ